MKSDGEMAMEAEIRQVPCQPSNHASAAQREVILKQRGIVRIGHGRQGVWLEGYRTGRA